MRTFLLIGNVGDLSTKKTQIPTVERMMEDAGKNSKTFYIFDRYNIDTIPLDTEVIIVVDKNKENI